MSLRDDLVNQQKEQSQKNREKAKEENMTEAERKNGAKASLISSQAVFMPSDGKKKAKRTARKKAAVKGHGKLPGK